MMSHPALFTHAVPKQVVIIGGGDCGTLREVLRHPGVESAVQCDIDEQVTRMSEKYFPELCESNDDPRARLLFDDGIAYMANRAPRSEEHTSELQSLMRISSAVLCLKKKNRKIHQNTK